MNKDQAAKALQQAVANGYLVRTKARAWDAVTDEWIWVCLMDRRPQIVLHVHGSRHASLVCRRCAALTRQLAGEILSASPHPDSMKATRTVDGWCNWTGEPMLPGATAAILTHDDAYRFAAILAVGGQAKEDYELSVPDGPPDSDGALCGWLYYDGGYGVRL